MLCRHSRSIAPILLVWMFTVPVFPTGGVAQDGLALFRAAAKTEARAVAASQRYCRFALPAKRSGGAN